MDSLDFMMERIFLSTLQAFSTICGFRGFWGVGGIQLLWLSDRGLAAQARGVLGSTPGDCQLFTFLYFRHITPKIFFFPPLHATCYKNVIGQCTIVWLIVTYNNPDNLCVTFHFIIQLFCTKVQGKTNSLQCHCMWMCWWLSSITIWHCHLYYNALCHHSAHERISLAIKG